MEKVTKIYNSLSAMIEDLNTAPLGKYAGHYLESESNDSKWTGTADYESANRLALTGDSAIIEKMKKAVAKYEKPQAPKPVRRLSVCGGAPVVPLYLSGCPQNMAQRVKQPTTNNKIITVYINTGVSGATSASEVIDRGAIILNELQALQAAGYRVTVYAGTVTNMDSNLVEMFVKVKDSSEPFNLSRLSYPVACPSFQRRHSFRFRECYSPVYCSEYGFSTNIDTKRYNGICLNMRELVRMSYDSIHDLIIKQLNK